MKIADLIYENRNGNTQKTEYVWANGESVNWENNDNDYSSIIIKYSQILNFTTFTENSISYVFYDNSFVDNDYIRIISINRNEFEIYRYCYLGANISLTIDNILAKYTEELLNHDLFIIKKILNLLILANSLTAEIAEYIGTEPVNMKSC